MSYWDRRDDAQNLAIIVGCGAMAAMVTAGLLFADSPTASVAPLAVEAQPVDLPPFEMSAPLTGSNRLYGTVTTRGGQSHTGYLRWDRNEGSWTDLLEATKRHRARAETLSGMRFGHIQRIDVTGRRTARFLLNDGQTVSMAGHASDLGTGLRSLQVDGAAGQTELEWRDLRSVTFAAAPRNERPRESRLYGTMTTRSGDRFTGYVTWDVDEIYTTDILDGDERGVRRKIPFGAIGSIARESSSAARVRLNDGHEMILRGTNDVNRSNSGISVSDPALGQVKVSWDAFADVRFHRPDAESERRDFQGAERLEGTVVTESGDEIRGAIRWDRDESYGWELLDGDHRGIEFKIEFSQIARIDKLASGARVTLKDGRTFALHGSNDVNRSNRGVVVGDEGRVVHWRDFESLTLH